MRLAWSLGVVAAGAFLFSNCTKLERGEEAPKRVEQPVPKRAEIVWPPEPKGPLVATVEITPPEGNAGKEIFAGLKLNGRIVARGKAVVPESGTVSLPLNAMSPGAVLAPAEYVLWLTIHRDAFRSCYPGFGDMFAIGSWRPGAPPYVIRVTNPALWKEKKLSQPDNLVTIHYHRYDEEYDDAGLWTWDAAQKLSPQQNEIFEAGRDEFGLIFQLDRAEYGIDGNAEKIGLLPRVGGDWKGKDGGDKFWTPALGREVFLLGASTSLASQRPDTAPPLAAAFLDAADRITVQLGRSVAADEIQPGAVSITNEQGERSDAASATVMTKAGETKSAIIELTTASPLDTDNHDYKVSIEGFAGTVPAVPRKVPDRRDKLVGPQRATRRFFTPQTPRLSASSCLRPRQRAWFSTTRPLERLDAGWFR